MSHPTADNPFVQIGEHPVSIHFAHANGYHPLSYSPLLVELSKEHGVIAMQMRAFWPNSDPNRVKSWDILADDLIRFLENRMDKPIIGIGHSMGAITTLIASIKRPDLFEKMILLDPVLLPDHLRKKAAWMPIALKKKVIPIAKIASNRRYQWPSKSQAFDYLRPKKVFARISDENLKIILEHALIPSSEGVQLAYSREWEAQIYCTSKNHWPFLSQTKVPFTVIRGEYSDILFGNNWDRLQSIVPANRLDTLPKTGHLLTHEEPQVLAKMILEHLREMH